MKRYSVIIVAVLLCTSVFPSLALGNETTGSVEPTVGPPPLAEPYFVDEWAEVGSGVNSRNRNGAPKDPQWVDWVFEVRGIIPDSEGGANATLKGAGRLYQDVLQDGVYRFRTLEHDTLLEAQVGCLVASGKPLEVPLTIELIGIEFGPEKVVAPVQASTPVAERPESTPVTEANAAPVATSDPDLTEPFLPYTGGREDIPAYVLLCLALGIPLRVFSSQRFCASF